MEYSEEALKGLPDKDLWDLEDRLGAQLGAVSTEIDERIKKYVSEGMTQAKIAKQVGRSQQTISRRMERLGLEPKQPNKSHKVPAASSSAPLTERQQRAIELVKQGKSYRQIGEELDTDESLIRKDPIIRAVREEHDPDAHSVTTRQSWAACRTLTVKDHIENIEDSVEYLFDMDMYKIGRADRNRLRKIANNIKERLDAQER